MQNSELWKRGFADERADNKVSRLADSLRRIRENAAHLTSDIAGSLPSLTIHDISHLDALWDVASTVAGNDFPLNPLEAYIFGAAVLLHDAGLCFAAYTGGRDALRRTLEWRDAHARLAAPPSGAQDIKRDADFEALRALHASQAERLAVEPIGEQQNGNYYLIEDTGLRENYGPIIGLVASSHHWNLEQVTQRFSTRRPPASFLDANWIVDSLKIACMLRVSDAGHMDGARAPSFLLKILQMNSVSRAHWTAQNRLGKLTVSPNDPTELTIASTSPFPRREAGAWWVAYDLVELFDKELRACNEALANSPQGPRQSFARKRVRGAAHVTELAKHVQTVGWEPTESTVHVSDVSALVEKLGGEQLYGRDADCLAVGLRELIQNAADAISARRLVAHGEFVGRITVRLMRRANDGLFLQVDDDGVGMSQTTLSTDLLDFGKSFWASERAAREFSGIHASGYSPVGQFGIGFFSIFMAAKKVRVFSRRFDNGLEEVRCLSFENGISLRPTLSVDRPSEFGMDLSTRVELDLKQNMIEDPHRIEIRCNLQGHKNFRVGFKDYVAAIVAGVNVPVFVETEIERVQVHERFPPERAKREQWLRSLSYVCAGVNKNAIRGLSRALARLRPISDGDKVYGLAAINVLDERSGLFLSAKSVGGLVSPHNCHGGSFVGLIHHLPASAKREAGEIAAPKQSMDAWMSEQLALLKNADMSDSEALLASYSICALGYDPKDVLRALLVMSSDGYDWWPITAIADKINAGVRLLWAVSGEIGSLDQWFQIRPASPDIRICVAFRNGRLNDAKLSDGIPANPHSLIGIVHRVLKECGFKPRWMIKKGSYRGVFGLGDMLEVSI